jgi:hypothetical protein
VSHELLAIVLIIVVHVIGAGVLVWAMLGEEGINWYRSRPDEDEGWHRGPPEPPAPPAPSRGPDGLPLPDAAPSATRLRGPERAGDWRKHHRRPTPQHPPRTPAER